MHTARRFLAAGVFTLLGAVAVAAAPVPAWADGADQIIISGDELPEPMVWRASDSPRLVEALHSEVSWLVGRKATTEEPEPETLGPGYVLDVHVEGEARHRFHLYPLAEGGPRVFRPEDQPGDRQTDPAWYFGRLSMPDTLYAAGIEIPGAQPRVPGGGGGGGEPAPEEEVPSPDQGSGVLETWRGGMQLVALIAAAIAAGLAAVALLIRRKV